MKFGRKDFVPQTVFVSVLFVCQRGKIGKDENQKTPGESIGFAPLFERRNCVNNDYNEFPLCEKFSRVHHNDEVHLYSGRSEGTRR